MTSNDWQVERTRALLQDPEWVKRSEKFREHIFETHRFTPAAREFIRANSRIIVLDFASEQGGGGHWPPGSFDSGPVGLVQLFTAQHEAAVHELSHVWWHFWRLHHPGLKKDLVRNLVILAGLNRDEFTDRIEAINIAYTYVHGDGVWLGMLGNADGRNNPANLPKDIHSLTEEDFEFRVNDWEIFAGLASFTMGRFNEGPRKLPPSMYIYFEPLFMGALEEPASVPPPENPAVVPPAAEEPEMNPEEWEPTAVEPEAPEPPPPVAVPGEEPVVAEPPPTVKPSPPVIPPPAQETPGPAPKKEAPVPPPRQETPGRLPGAATTGHNCMLATILMSLLRR